MDSVVLKSSVKVGEILSVYYSLGLWSEKFVLTKIKCLKFFKKTLLWYFGNKWFFYRIYYMYINIIYYFTISYASHILRGRSWKSTGKT